MKIISLLTAFLSLYSFDINIINLGSNKEISSEIIVESDKWSDSTEINRFRLESYVYINKPDWDFVKYNLPQDLDCIMQETQNKKLNEIIVYHDFYDKIQQKIVYQIKLPLTWNVNPNCNLDQAFLWKENGVEVYVSEAKYYYSKTDSFANLDKIIPFKKTQTIDKLIEHELTESMSNENKTLLSAKRIDIPNPMGRFGWHRYSRINPYLYSAIYSTEWENEIHEKSLMLLRYWYYDYGGNSYWGFSTTKMNASESEYNLSKKEITEAVLQRVREEEYTENHQYRGKINFDHYNINEFEKEN